MDHITVVGLHICIRSEGPEGYHRRSMRPGADVSGEAPEVRDVAAKFWTDEAVEAWLSSQDEQRAMVAGAK